MHAAHCITRLTAGVFSVLSQNTCRAPNTQLLAPASAVCCKRCLVSFDTWLWSLSPVLFYVMESDLVRGMLQQKSQRGRRERKWLEYVLCFNGDYKMAVEQYLGFKVTNMCILLQWLLLFGDFPVQHLCLTL